MLHVLYPTYNKMSSSSQRVVLTSSPDGPIIAYDPSLGTTLAHFSGSRSPRRGLVVTGNSFIAASHISSDTGSSSIHLYNSWSSTAFQNLPVPEPVAPLAASVDGMYLFAGGISGNIHSLLLPSGTVLKSFLAHNKPVSCLKISDDGSLLVSGHDDGTIVVVPIFKLLEASGDNNSSDFALQKFVAHEKSVTSITSCMGSCNPGVVSCSSDCTCKFWDILNGTALFKLAFPCAILDLALNPTETSFYAAGSDGLVYHGILNAGTKQLVSQGHKLVTWTKKHDSAIVSVVMVNEGQNLVSAAEDGSVWVWDVEKGKVIMVLGNDMGGSISDLVVGNRVGGVKGHGAIQVQGNGIDEFGGKNFGLCVKELGESVNETLELEDKLKVARKDKRKATDMLESAINMYVRLLELILRQAKESTSYSSENDDM